MSSPSAHKWMLGEKFDTVYPHLESIQALWEKKWKFPCTKSLYPFHDGRYEDFEPIFEALIEKGIHSGYTDEYTKEFIPTAERLVTEADALVSINPKEACSMYLRACAVARIARFPYINSDLKRIVYGAQNATYMKAAVLWDCPMVDISIPHTAGTSADGDSIPLYVRFPKSATAANPSPAILLITGLDGHRPDNTVRSDEFLTRGWASVILDIPGTADCPADRKDPASADRLFASILDWMVADGRFDTARIVAWGLSAGGYNAIRVAHTHHDRLLGVVAQGAGSHHFFSREWLEKAQGHEYPWNLMPAIVEKFGYKDEEEMMQKAQEEWSLVENGILDGPSCRLLLVNGTHDGLMPIEDSLLCFEHGEPKEGRFFSGLLHMGYPPANGSVYPWMEEIMASVNDRVVVNGYYKKAKDAKAGPIVSATEVVADGRLAAV